MTGIKPWARMGAGVALLALAACGGRGGGDWRAEFGRPTPNAVVVTPNPPLAIPPVLDLPPPPRLAGS